MHWHAEENRRRNFVVLAFLILAGCSQPASDSQLKVAAPPPQQSLAELKRYDLIGEVKELDTKGKIAKIQHQKIGDWMEAMTMEFPVKDPADFVKLKVGQKVRATVFVQDIQFWVGEIKEESPSSPK